MTSPHSIKASLIADETESFRIQRPSTGFLSWVRFSAGYILREGLMWLVEAVICLWKLRPWTSVIIQRSMLRRSHCPLAWAIYGRIIRAAVPSSCHFRDCKTLLCLWVPRMQSVITRTNTLSLKKTRHLILITRQNSNCFTVIFLMESRMYSLFHCSTSVPHHHKCVDTPPCETCKNKMYRFQYLPL